jgi:hypothetical protein
VILGAARGEIRDTGAVGAGRYHWTVTVFGDHQVGGDDHLDLDLSQRRFARPSYRLFVHTARQGQVALGARLENGIHGRVSVIFSPSLYNARCLLVQRWPEVPPLKIFS